MSASCFQALSIKRCGTRVSLRRISARFRLYILWFWSCDIYIDEVAGNGNFHRLGIALRVLDCVELNGSIYLQFFQLVRFPGHEALRAEHTC